MTGRPPRCLLHHVLEMIAQQLIHVTIYLHFKTCGPQNKLEQILVYICTRFVQVSSALQDIRYHSVIYVFYTLKKFIDYMQLQLPKPDAKTT